MDEQDYMRLPYRIDVVEDKQEGGFVFCCPELRGCITVADDIQTGFEMLEDAKKEWFSACLKGNIPIPMPEVAVKHRNIISPIVGF